MMYYIVGAVVSYPLIVGMLFQNLQSIGLDYRTKNFRSDLGASMSLGIPAVLIWPISIIIIFLMTGFAEHGIFKFKQ